jgi:hypothetical protein
LPTQFACEGDDFPFSRRAADEANPILQSGGGECRRPGRSKSADRLGIGEHEHRPDETIRRR